MDYYIFQLSNLMVKVNLGCEIIDEGLFEKEIDYKQNKKKELNISCYAKLEKLGIFLGKQKNYGHSSLKFMEDLSH